MLRFLFLFLILNNSIQAKGKTPAHFDIKRPEILENLKTRGFEFTVNQSLEKDCLSGNHLSCAILRYRIEKTRKNAIRVSKILKNYPCRVSKINNCLEHLYARIFMEKHRSAKKLAYKMCQLDNKVSCRQLEYYRSLSSSRLH